MMPTTCLVLSVLASAAMEDVAPARRGVCAPPAGVEKIEPCFEAGTAIGAGGVGGVGGAPGGAEWYFFNGRGPRGGYNGDARTVAWSLVSDGTLLGTVDLSSTDRPLVLAPTGSVLFSVMNGNFGGNPQNWITLIRSEFNRIQALTGVRFQEIPDSGLPMNDANNRTDVIRIAMRPVDGRSSILAFAGFNVTLDSAESWSDNANAWRRLRNVFAHEVGHALGLAHSCPTNNTKLMEPFLSLTYDGPQHDDVRGLQNIYGDANEPNDAPFQATEMPTSDFNQTFNLYGDPYGTIAFGGTAASIVGGDVDWFHSTLAAAASVSVTVTPRGLAYDTSTQNGDGTCNSGSVVDSLTLARLRVRIYAGSGALLAEAASPLPGLPATASVSVPAGGYYVRVEGVSQPAQPQAYTLTRTIGAGQAPGNDLCANAEPITNLPLTGSTLAATRDGAGVVDFQGTVGRNDVYYRYTPLASGRVRISARRADQSAMVVTVHTGCPAQRTTQLPFGPDPTARGFGAFDADVTAYQTYIICVATPQNTPDGPFTLDANFLNAPANDRCTAPANLTMGTVSVNNTFAHMDDPIGVLCGEGPIGDGHAHGYFAPGLWYRYSAPADGVLTVRTCGSTVDTNIAVFAGCPGPGESPLACNHHTSIFGDCGGSSTVSLPVTGGETYLVRAGGFVFSLPPGSFQPAVGSFPLTASFTMANDACGGAIDIPSDSVGFDNRFASTEGPAEQACGSFLASIIMQGDLWYRFDATCTGVMTIDTFGSNFDTTLALYADCPSGATSIALACNDDFSGFQSRIAASIVGGRRYYVRVGGYGASRGQGTIHLSCASCPADFNRDGSVDPDDLSDFIACYFGTPACPQADYNADGHVDPDDLSDFIGVFFAGCN